MPLFVLFGMITRSVVIKSYNLFSILRYSLQKALTWKFLSSTDLCSNLSRGFPLLECLNILFGKKLPDTFFVILYLVLIVLRVPNWYSPRVVCFRVTWDSFYLWLFNLQSHIKKRTYNPHIFLPIPQHSHVPFS